MPEPRSYMYGLAASGTLSRPLAAQGLPDGRTPVSAISVGGAAAIVGPYQGPPLSDLPQPDVLRHLTIHQRVIEDVMRQGDVLPARFGTVLSGEDEVRSFLSRWGELVQNSLARYSGLVEVEAAATWDVKKEVAEVAREPQVQDARARAEQAPAAERSAHQLRLGRLVKELLDARRERRQQELLLEVAGLAADVQPNAVLTDELVFNVAFLLERDALPEFDDALERFDAASGGTLSIRRIGPLPPYSFASVRVVRFDAERLAAGRALLGLPGEITEDAVVSSFRRIAREAHPDNNPADPAAPERFAALHAARDDLLAYCRSRGQGESAQDGSALMVMIGPSGGAAGDGNGDD